MTCACLVVGAVLAATPPSGGTDAAGAGDVCAGQPPSEVLPGTEQAPLLPERAAPAPAAAGRSFVLRSVRFSGNTAFADAQLQAGGAVAGEGDFRRPAGDRGAGERALSRRGIPAGRASSSVQAIDDKRVEAVR